MEKLGHKIMLFAAIFTLVLTVSVYATPPKVIKAIPENGDQNVNPSLQQIRIEFDQDMNQQGYSICGGGPKFPKIIGKPMWASKRILIAAVKLEPNSEYEMSINCPSYQNCKNVGGEPAETYPINFKTGSAAVEPNAPSKSPAISLQQGRVGPHNPTKSFLWKLIYA